MKKRILVPILAIVFMLMFTGCSSNEAVTGPEEVEKVLRIGTPYTIDTFNPFMYSSDGDRYVIGQIMEALVDGDAGHYYPLLAESWENLDDTTWEFKIREDAYWHTGNAVYSEGEKVKVTAEDVKACFEFVLNAENEARLQPVLDGSIKEVKVMEGNVVRFVTKEPSAFFLQQINKVPIFSVEAYNKLGRKEFDKHPIGSGPFKFVEYRTDDKVVLEKNVDYHITPNVDKVVFQIIPDKSVSAIALQNNEIDISLQVPPADVDKVKQSGSATVVPNSSGWYRYVAFNFDNPLFQDKKVREAISLAVDMDSAVEAIFDKPGLAERAPGPVPRGIPGFNEDWKDMWEFNPDKAQQMLTEAGWKPGDDGILEKDGQKFSFVLKAPNDVNRAKLAVIVATQLKSIGIDCKPQPQEWATHLSDIRAGNVEMFIMGGGSTIDGLTYMFWRENAAGGAHDTRYVNPEVDRLIETATRTVDADERERLWEQAARTTIEDRVHLSAYYEYVQIGVADKVKGFDPPSVWLSLVSPLRNVSIETK